MNGREWAGKNVKHTLLSCTNMENAIYKKEVAMNE
jgi:hypothetical protein